MDTRPLTATTRWIWDHLTPLLTALVAARHPLTIGLVIVVIVATLTCAILILGRAYTRLNEAERRSIRHLIREYRGRIPKNEG